jgi:hypothetical protein
VEGAGRVFAGSAVAFGVAVALIGSLSVHATWAARRLDFQQVADTLARAGSPPSDRVMSIDASGTKYWSGHGGVVLVNDPLATIGEVAKAYDIRWLVLDRAESVPAVAPILDRAARPGWLGEPVVTVPLNHESGDLVAVESGVYPVCMRRDRIYCRSSARSATSP